ncbi:MAG: leucine-rich repeat protein [Ruminococcus sp.]|nr:leucine-rich repeat protein [Ruminococcus sp.]
MNKAFVIAAALCLLAAGSNVCGAFAPASYMTASAAETASGTCGKSLTWTFSSGTLTVSGTGEMYSRNSQYSVPWADFKDDITSVAVGEGVTSIGGQAFDSCKNLTAVSLPSTLKSIGTYSFSGCSSLTKVTIPNGVTSIGSSAFASCKKLADIDIPRSVSYIGDIAFAGTKWLENNRSKEQPFVIVNGILINGSLCTGDAVIPDGVTDIAGNAFYYCTGITSLTIPESVAIIRDNAFNYCTGLTSVTIPASVTEVGMQAFVMCDKLAEVTVLNPDCKIYDRKTTFANDNETFAGTIRGYDGSTAETYAKKYSRTFVSLGRVPTLGDPNADGSIDAKDASFILAEYSRLSAGGAPTFTAAQRTAADVNTDGLTDSKDASKILGYYAYTSTGGTEDFNAFIAK